jgi:hypothetical protein
MLYQLNSYPFYVIYNMGVNVGNHVKARPNRLTTGDVGAAVTRRPPKSRAYGIEDAEDDHRDGQYQPPA